MMKTTLLPIHSLILLLFQFFPITLSFTFLNLHKFSPKTVSFQSSGSSDEEGPIIDADTLGIYSEKDYECKSPFEFDPDEDPNELEPSLEYYNLTRLDEDGIEIGWDPIFGPSNPIDGRTIITPVESYMTADESRDDTMLPPLFRDEDDVEIRFNDEIKELRKEMKLVDTYKDPYLQMDVPSHVATWHGYPEMSFPKQDFMNNRFTNPEDKTDFSKMDPYRARKMAVQMARSKNNEWLPEGKSRDYKLKQTDIFREKGILVGSLKKGECNPEIVEKIQPVLKILGSVVELLSIELETVFRFHYYGQMKNRKGMEAWTGTLIRDCGVECTGVVFETGGRRRDPGE